MILDEHGEEVHPVDDHPELLYQGLAVEEVVGGNEEIPGEGPEPGQVVHLVHCVSDVDNLRETLKIDLTFMFFDFFSEHLI